jgi:hypothetical protein
MFEIKPYSLKGNKQRVLNITVAINAILIALT